MNNVQVLSKETLLVYLINELGDGNFKVTTVLDENGCWTNKVIIEGSTNENNEDNSYYKELVKGLM